MKKRIAVIMMAVVCLFGHLVCSSGAASLSETKTYEGFSYYIRTDSAGRRSVRFTGEYDGAASETLKFPSEIEGVPVYQIGTWYTPIFEKEFPAITRLVIPEGVQLIGGLALDKLPNLREVVLPRSLKGILWECFADCPNLTQLTVPAGVSLIGKDVFDSHITLRGESGSYAERYAAHHGLAFEPIVYEMSVGDLDADGLCTSTDARLILQHTVGKTALEKTFADVDGDGTVTTTDARLCLQYAVGKAEIALEVPAARPSEDLISSAAQVYADYSSLYEGGKRAYAPAADRLGAIRAANAIFAGSYDTGSFTPDSLPICRFYFIEPDGTRITLTLKGGLEVNVDGYKFAWLSFSEDAWDDLIVAVG